MFIPDDENDKNYSEDEQLMRKVIRLIKQERPDANMIDIWIWISLVKLKLEMQLAYHEHKQLDELLKTNSGKKL